MADVKWIKLVTDMFDNRKIKQIRKLPDGDAIIVVWVQILCLAGQTNDNGLVYFAKDIPYTDEMLSVEFDRPINLIRLALSTFERFKMIEIVDNLLLVSNWEKYQSTDKLNEIKEQNRLRQQKYREKQRLVTKSNVTVTLPLPLHNALDIDKELDKDIDKDIDKEIKKKPQKHKYGEYQNVLLSDEQLEKLQNEFPTDWESRIERVSEYCASTGKPYKDFLATIRSWARKEQPNANKQYNTSNPFLQMIQDEMEKEGYANG